MGDTESALLKKVIGSPDKSKATEVPKFSYVEGTSTSSFQDSLAEWVKVAPRSQDPATFHKFQSATDTRISLLLKAILEGKQPETVLAVLQKSAAQHVLDRIQHILDTASFGTLFTAVFKPKSELVARKSLRHILHTLSKFHDQHPSVLFLADVNGQTLKSTGGYADVYTGTYQGGKVAVKKLRVFLSDSLKILVKTKRICTGSP